jgi:TRAP transporter TAXI family solute receptor
MTARNICVALAVWLLSLGPAAAENYVLAGASPSGLWTTLGTGIDNALRAANPDDVVTYQTSGGGFANVGLLREGKVRLAIIHNAELKLAQEGREPFDAPVGDLRVLAQLYDFAAVHMLLRKSFADEHGLGSLADIARVKPALDLAINKRGNIASMLVERLFEASGFTLADIEAWGGSVAYASSQEALDLYKDGRIDFMPSVVFVGNSTVMEAADSAALTMLSMTEDARAAAVAEFATAPLVVPAGAYAWLDSDMPTVALSASLVARADMPDEEAHRLVAALLEHLDQLQAAHKALKSVTPELMAGQTSSPYHPGAVAAYREAGLMN